MILYKDSDLIKINNPVITVGTFDGIHLGHQHIFKNLIQSADEIGGEPVIITFWPHPRIIVHPGGTDILLLNTLEEKIKLIKQQGIKHFILIDFTKEFSELSSKDFIEEYLFKRIGIKGLIIGYDHRFGKDRLGNSEQLNQCASKYGFFIRNIDAFCIDGEKISSTKIRNALLSGEIEAANKMLSANYSLTGKVEDGYKIGRNLGFPTANIKPLHPFKLVPADGVYAVRVSVEGTFYPGMLNIGIRPTVNRGNDNKTIEVHIIGFDGNLYGKEISLFFYKKIRNEMKFNSLNDLKMQLEQDRQQVIDFFQDLL